MKRALLALSVFFVLSAALPAQTRTSLTIRSSQPGAKVYINNNFVGMADPEFSALLASDSKPYSIKVSKDGFQDFLTTIMVQDKPIAITATLIPLGQKPPAPTPPSPPAPPAPQPTTYTLSIESNVSGAQVFVDGIFYGTAPLSIRLQPRRYTIRVSKQGYKDFSRSLDLKRTERLFAAVEPILHPIYIESANAPGARLYRDSVDLGPLPYRGAWPMGNYSLRIEAPGYVDFYDFADLQGPFNLRVSLTPKAVEYEIVIPEFFASFAGRPLGFENMALFLDGARIFSPYGSLLPGPHRLEMYIGEFRFETSFDISIGTKVFIEPFLGIRVR